MNYEPEKLVGIYIPGYIANREDLTRTEKYLFGIVNGLSQKTGYCYASNYYLARKAGCSGSTASRAISKLKELKLWDVEVLIFNKSDDVEATDLGTKRFITPFALGEMPRGVRTSDEGGTHQCVDPLRTSDEGGYAPVLSIDKKIYRKSKKGGVEGRGNSHNQEGLSPFPNPTYDGGGEEQVVDKSPTVNPDLLEHLRKRRDRKTTKGMWKNPEKVVTHSQGELTRDEGLAISLTDNVDMPALVEKHGLTLDQVIKCKQNYINWVMGSSYDKKTWGKDMSIYVERFCSQEASKSQKKDSSAPDPINDDLYTYFDKIYGKK